MRILVSLSIILFFSTRAYAEVGHICANVVALDNNTAIMSHNNFVLIDTGD